MSKETEGQQRHSVAEGRERGGEGERKRERDSRSHILFMSRYTYPTPPRTSSYSCNVLVASNDASPNASFFIHTNKKYRVYEAITRTRAFPCLRRGDEPRGSFLVIYIYRDGRENYVRVRMCARVCPLYVGGRIFYSKFIARLFPR